MFFFLHDSALFGNASSKWSIKLKFCLFTVRFPFLWLICLFRGLSCWEVQYDLKVPHLVKWFETCLHSFHCQNLIFQSIQCLPQNLQNLIMFFVQECMVPTTASMGTFQTNLFLLLSRHPGQPLIPLLCQVSSSPVLHVSEICLSIICEVNSVCLWWVVTRQPIYLDIIVPALKGTVPVQTRKDVTFESVSQTKNCIQ